MREGKGIDTVYVRGWSSYDEPGAISQSQCATLLAHLERHSKPEVWAKITQKLHSYEENRQILLKISGGVQECWRVRNHLAEVSSKLGLKVKSKDLTFAVERTEEEKRVNAITNQMTQLLKSMLNEEDARRVRPHWASQSVQLWGCPVGKLVNNGEEKWVWFKKQLKRLCAAVDLDMLEECSQL